MNVALPYKNSTNEVRSCERTRLAGMGAGEGAWAFRAPHPTVVAALLNATGRILPFRGVGH